MTQSQQLARAVAIVAVIAWIAVTGPVPSKAADQAATEQIQTPTLILSSDMQGAGATAVISLTLRMPEGASVGRAVSEVSFPKQFLQFHNATRGLSTEAAGGDIKVVPLPDADGQGVVQVTASAKEGESLPAGSLAELRFRVLKGAKVDAKLVLANTASAYTDAAGTAKIEGVVARNGEVRVTKSTLLPACFFYMH